MNFFDRLRFRFLKLLSSELSARKVALSISLGLVLGIIPFFLGLNILLAAIVSWRLRLNHLLIQFVSNVIYPIQILLFLPFLRAGVSTFSSDSMEFSSFFLLSLFRDDVFGGIKLLGLWNVYALVYWALIAVPLAYVLYHVAYFLIFKFRLLPARVLINELWRQKNK